MTALHRKRDGLLLVCNDRSCVYLTPFEAFLVKLGLLSLETLEKKYGSKGSLSHE